MTCREKLKIEHPECVNNIYKGGCKKCPSDYGYSKNVPDLCDDGNAICAEVCRKCWDSELVEKSEPEPLNNLENYEELDKLKTALSEAEKSVYNTCGVPEERLTMYRVTATELWHKYRALVDAGFTEDQAMSLIPIWSA